MTEEEKRHALEGAIKRWVALTPTQRAMALLKIPHESCSAKPRYGTCLALDAARDVLMYLDS